LGVWIQKKEDILGMERKRYSGEFYQSPSLNRAGMKHSLEIILYLLWHSFPLFFTFSPLFLGQSPSNEPKHLLKFHLTAQVQTLEYRSNIWFNLQV